MTLNEMKLDLHELQRLISAKKKAIIEEDNYFNKIKSKYGLLKICGNRDGLLTTIKEAIADEVMKS